MRQREITNEQLLTAVMNVFAEERDHMRKAFEAERRELLRQWQLEHDEEMRRPLDAPVLSPAQIRQRANRDRDRASLLRTDKPCRGWKQTRNGFKRPSEIRDLFCGHASRK
jgi:hypothetical protein